LPTWPLNVTINHNTSFSSREDTFSAWGPTSGFTFTNNVLRHNRCLATFPNDCGISGNGTLPGTATLNAWLGSPVVVSGNILFDAGRDRSADYPVGNTFPYGTEPLFPYAFQSSCDGSNVIDLQTGVPASATSEPDYTVVSADITCATVPAADGTGPVGADWNALKIKVNAATSGQ